MALEYMKECPIGAHKAQVLMSSPSTCIDDHGRACQRCWEHHLSGEVETRPNHDFRCMFCLQPMERQDLERLARKGTIRRYKFLTQETVDETKHRRCPDSCVASRMDEQQPRSTEWQPYNPDAEGRLFTCQHCGAETCTSCDRPEHHGRTCEEFRDQVLQKPEHLENEARTDNLIAQLFTDGECAHCPSCGVGYGKGAGCEYLQCEGCQFRFCGDCFAPWVGPHGEYVKGSLAHKKECRFRTQEPHTDHSYRSRHNRRTVEPEQEVQGRRTRSGKILKTIADSSETTASRSRCRRTGDSTVVKTECEDDEGLKIKAERVGRAICME